MNVEKMQALIGRQKLKDLNNTDSKDDFCVMLEEAMDAHANVDLSPTQIAKERRSRFVSKFGIYSTDHKERALQFCRIIEYM